MNVLGTWALCMNVLFRIVYIHGEYVVFTQYFFLNWIQDLQTTIEIIIILYGI